MQGRHSRNINKMQPEVFEVLAGARSLEALRWIEPRARQVYRRYLDELGEADAKELAIHRMVSRLNYSRRCAEASAVQAHMKQSIPLAPGMEIGYVIPDAYKWAADPERTASKFDALYYRGLLKKSLAEAAFVFSKCEDPICHSPRNRGITKDYWCDQNYYMGRTSQLRRTLEANLCVQVEKNRSALKKTI